MVGLLVRWAVNAVALYLTAVVVAGLVLGIVNAVLRPIALLLTLPLNILTLGLFTFVINATMLYIVAAVTHRVRIDSFLSALVGAVVLSVISFILSHVVAE